MSESKKEQLKLVTPPRALDFTPTYKAGQFIEYDPNKLIIAEDKNDPLFDVRGLGEADKALVQSIKDYGFGSAIWAVEREKGKLTVVAGRRRTLSAREADEEVTCLILDPTLSDYELVSRMIAENEARQEDTVMNKARKAARLVNLGLEAFRPVDKDAVEVDEETGEVQYNGEGWRPSRAQRAVVINDVARRFGLQPRRINQLLELLELSPKVQKALEAGKISEAVAIAWKDKSHERQDALLEAALEKAKGAKLKAKGGSRGKDGEYPKLQFKRPELEEIRLTETGVPKAVVDFLDYHLGYLELEDAPRWIQKRYAAQAEVELDATEAADDEEWDE
jgi:ParB-like chromosome segregation protein Spo0J